MYKMVYNTRLWIFFESKLLKSYTVHDFVHLLNKNNQNRVKHTTLYTFWIKMTKVVYKTRLSTRFQSKLLKSCAIHDFMHSIHKHIQIQTVYTNLFKIFPCYPIVQSLIQQKLPHYDHNMSTGWRYLLFYAFLLCFMDWKFFIFGSKFTFILCCLIHERLNRSKIIFSSSFVPSNIISRYPLCHCCCWFSKFNTIIISFTIIFMDWTAA